MPVRNYRPLSQRYPSDVLWISKVWSMSILYSGSQSSKRNGSRWSLHMGFERRPMTTRLWHSKSLPNAISRLWYPMVFWHIYGTSPSVKKKGKSSNQMGHGFYSKLELYYNTIELVLLALFRPKNRGHHHEHHDFSPMETVNQRSQDQRWSGTSATARLMCTTLRLGMFVGQTEPRWYL